MMQVHILGVYMCELTFYGKVWRHVGMPHVRRNLILLMQANSGRLHDGSPHAGSLHGGSQYFGNSNVGIHVGMPHIRCKCSPQNED